MERLAEELNRIIKDNPVYDMLSDYGKRMYVPNGIVVQSAQAKQKATKYNATIGVALDHKVAMHLSGVMDQYAPTMSPGEIFPYAPMGGVPALRQKWQDNMRIKNPLLKDARLSLPVVCAGLTNCLSIVCNLFMNKGDAIVMPDLYWENYDLIVREQCQANRVFYKFFDGNHFNLKGFDEAIGSVKEKKVTILVNFPNNPTGYTPTDYESDQMALIIEKYAKAGKLINVICDDAYFGLFYEEETCKQSLFAKVCNLHENVLAIKCDGATKEEMVWGFRIAFVTYACKGLDEKQLDVLVQKTLGTVRGRLSNCNTGGQNILLKAMNDPRYAEEKARGVKIIGERYFKLKECLAKYSDKNCLRPLPFNSGYFMSFVTECNAEELRQLLLNEYATGTICLGEHLLRIAFSSVDLEDIPGIVETVYKAAESLC